MDKKGRILLIQVRPFCLGYKMLTQEEVRALFNYDPESGIVTRKVSVSTNTKIGDAVGSVPNKRKPYLRIQINGKDHYMHRIIWLYFYGSLPYSCIDHINGNGLDNRISNLRIVSLKENSKNQRLFKTSKTGLCGVYVTKSNKFCASIRINGKTLWLGTFGDIKEAANARKEANAAYGFHNNHGIAG